MDLIGDYEVIEVLEEGKNAQIYLVKKKTGEKMAIKIFREQALYSDKAWLSLRSNIQRLQSLKHRNIADIQKLEYCRKCGHFITMEYIQGYSLKKIIETPSTEIKLKDVLKIGIVIGYALEYMRKQNFVHGKLDPSNVLIDKQNKVIKMINIEINRFYRFKNESQTAQNELLEVPYYISPESISINQIIDHQSDIYSLGAILYYILTKHEPYSEFKTLFSILRAKNRQKPIPLQEYRPDISVSMSNIIEKAMVCDRVHRYQTAGEMIQEMQKLLENPDAQIQSSIPTANDFNVFAKSEQELKILEAEEIKGIVSQKLESLPVEITSQKYSYHPTLIMIEGKEGKSYLLESEKTSLGSLKTSDIFISDSLVSRNHALIEREGDFFKIKDCNSKNGTYVNDEYVTEKILADGDKILIGKTDFIFSCRELSHKDPNFAVDSGTIVQNKISLEEPRNRLVKETLIQIQEAQQTLQLISRLEQQLSQIDSEELLISAIFQAVEELYKDTLDQIVILQYDEFLDRNYLKKIKIEQQLQITEKILHEAYEANCNKNKMHCFLLEEKDKKNAVLVPFMYHSKAPWGFFYLESQSKSFSTKDINILAAITELFSSSVDRNEQIQRKVEMEMASKLQKITIKTGGFQYQGISQIYAIEGYSIYKPAKELGGDFYEIRWIKPYLYIFVGDVQGKGANAALVVSAIRAYISGILYSNAINLNIMAQNLDMYLMDTFPNMFTTMLILQWESETGKLKFINAGHHSPLVCTLQNNRWNFTEIEVPSAPPLGINKKIPRYPIQEKEYDWNENDFIFLYTDGITEAKDTEGIEFETEGLKKSLQEIIKIENMENLIDHIMKKLAEHCEGEQQFDDITLVACKLRAESTTTYNKLQVIM